VNDRIVLTIPTAHGFRGVASLVLGGVGSRVALPYERMDDLQLAALSVIESARDETVTVEIETQDGELSVTIGPLVEGAGSDQALANVLGRLVGDSAETRRDGQAWLTLRVPSATA